MIVACNHANGLQIAGITLLGNGIRDDGRRIFGGYAFTYNVPSVKWLKWVDANPDASVVETRCVLWAETEAELITLAKAR